MPAPARRAPARRAPARRSPVSPVVASATALLVLTACAPTAAGPGTGASATAAAPGFPLVVENCGVEVELEAPPERMVLLGSSWVPYLAELGALDRAVARAGAFPPAYYDEDVLAALEDVPLLGDDLDSGGHLHISREAVIAQAPDLVLGDADTVDRASLAGAGIPMLEEPTRCATAPREASFADITDQLPRYGDVLGTPEVAEEAGAALERRLEEITTAAAQQGSAEPRTAAVLYPTVGGGTTYAYGTASMAHPQLEGAGLRNVFADVPERVFEVSPEELVARDPDVLVLLHSDGAPGPVAEAVQQLPGASAITAVREDEVLVQLFNFTEPPTPLALEGLDRIVDRFGAPAQGRR
ncbi:ABC transporter substrate-binding protein [uncultured Pseudokineococcus sp.]|uniref:ABC transporter substrate-binding protein n=1 Tax=uncultured Pseudokineococcus sp. TaxID=1642928 RepID=UPI0026246D87|nr:ABC transporter substrate-binding protein [uncultured Pseudokineococcus sp.]